MTGYEYRHKMWLKLLNTLPADYTEDDKLNVKLGFVTAYRAAMIRASNLVSGNESGILEKEVLEADVGYKECKEI